MSGCNGFYMGENPLRRLRMGVSKTRRLPALNEPNLPSHFLPLWLNPHPPHFFVPQAPWPCGPCHTDTFGLNPPRAMGAETTVLSLLKQCFQWLDVSRGMQFIHWCTVFFVGFLDLLGRYVTRMSFPMYVHLLYTCTYHIISYHLILSYHIISYNINIWHIYTHVYNYVCMRRMPMYKNRQTLIYPNEYIGYHRIYIYIQM